MLIFADEASEDKKVLIDPSLNPTDDCIVSNNAKIVPLTGKTFITTYWLKPVVEEEDVDLSDLMVAEPATKATKK